MRCIRLGSFARAARDKRSFFTEVCGSALEQRRPSWTVAESSSEYPDLFLRFACSGLCFDWTITSVERRFRHASPLRPDIRPTSRLFLHFSQITRRCLVGKTLEPKRCRSRKGVGAGKTSEPKRRRGRKDIGVGTASESERRQGRKGVGVGTTSKPKRRRRKRNARRLRPTPLAHDYPFKPARLRYRACRSTKPGTRDAHGGFVETPAHTCMQALTSGIMYRLYTKLFLVSSCALPLEEPPSKSRLRARPPFESWKAARVKRNAHRGGGCDKGGKPLEETQYDRQTNRPSQVAHCDAFRARRAIEKGLYNAAPRACGVCARRPLPP